MSPTPTIKRKRDNPGESVKNGGPTSFAAQKREDSDIAPLRPTADPATRVETVYNRWYQTPEDKVDALTAEVARMKGVLGTAEAFGKLTRTNAKVPRFSLENKLVVGDQMETATRVAKWDKWDQLGRRVRKGEKGMAILDTKRVRVAIMDNAGRPQLDSEGKPRMETRLSNEPITATVFDISQTDGPALPAARRLTVAPPAHFIDDMRDAAANLGFTVEYEPMDEPGATSYATSDGDRRIVIKAGSTPTVVARALAHELGHITAGHLDRYDYAEGHGGADGQAEVEAESIAWAILEANGMKSAAGNSPEEIFTGWRNPSDAAVVAAAVTVHTAVRSLFIGVRWANARS